MQILACPVLGCAFRHWGRSCPNCLPWCLSTPRDGHTGALSHGRAVQLAHNPHYGEQRDDHHGSPIQEDKHLMDVPSPTTFLPGQKAGLGPGATHMCKVGSWRAATSGKWKSRHA